MAVKMATISGKTHRSGGLLLPLVQKYHILRGVESAKPIQPLTDYLVLAKLLSTHDGIVYSNGNRFEHTALAAEGVSNLDWLAVQDHALEWGDGFACFRHFCSP